MASPPQLARNPQAARVLLAALQCRGLAGLVLCPGSRSGPLAVAAALVEAGGLRLHTAIDERAAAFFALGLARARGLPAVVITTSGTAVANLLPAVVEADHGTIPLLLLTADRPPRLKGCGANQSVNQEDFLRSSCRWFAQGPAGGLGEMGEAELERLAEEAFRRALGSGGSPPGPVHLNLPFEEPLHADGEALAWLQSRASSPAAAPQREPQAFVAGSGPDRSPPSEPPAGVGEAEVPGRSLDPDRPGVVVAGPWRGSLHHWPRHVAALRRWQRRSGWPVLADVLSGLRGLDDLPLVGAYDLVLEQPPPALDAPQVLRLGPLPASRRLQRWLAEQGDRQVLVSEGDPRPLDPLGRVASQCPRGVEGWLDTLPHGWENGRPSPEALALAQRWGEAEGCVQALLARHLAMQPAPEGLSEPWLARRLGRLLPAGLPLMLANSSPVRDWESFDDPAHPHRPVFSFRGASGIDGTLSIACGLAEALGELVLVCGDLALLHDGNGWLWPHQMRGRLTILLIDNGGGGIFEQLPIRTDPGSALDFERLFAMPQPVDACALAAAHGVPARNVSQDAGLESALHWAIGQPRALLRFRTDRRADAGLRRRLRTMAALALVAA